MDYKSSADNKEIPKKKAGEDCKWGKGCFHNINEENRIDWLTKFLDIDNKDEQDLFLQGIIVGRDVERYHLRNEKVSNREKSFSYSVLIEDRRIEVRRKAFLSM